MAEFSGHCHCGNLEVSLRTETAAAALIPRACQCSFCRSHGAQMLADPSGSATIRIRDSQQFQRYRFGLRTADHLLCRICGVFVASVYDHDGQAFATINVGCFSEPPAGLPLPKPVVYDGESEPQRLRRQRAGWSPLVAFVLDG